MKTEDILARVRYDLPETGKIVVGLSGGADSVLLTYLLAQKFGGRKPTATRNLCRTTVKHLNFTAR